MLDFPLDQLEKSAPHVKWGDDQCVVLITQLVPRHRLKQIVELAAKVLVSGEQSKIGVAGGRRRVEIPGADVGIESHPVMLTPSNAGDLRVHLQGRRAVEYPDPRRLERPC